MQPLAQVEEIVNNRYANHMTLEDFRGIVDLLIEHEGTLETIALSGGEPTAHPQFLELCDPAARDEIGRISVVPNGIRIAQSKEFCEELKRRNGYVILQFDGFDGDVHRAIRRAPLREIEEQALDHLAEFDLSTQLAFVPVRGVNEHQLGRAVKLMLEREHVLSLLIQPFARTGQGGGV
jgi:hypothetical protein